MQVIEDQNLLSIGKRFRNHKSRGHASSGVEERTKTEGYISRRGSELALKHLSEKFGSSLFEKLPKLWDCLTEFLKPVEIEDDIQKDDPSIAQLGRYCEDKDPQSVINNIQVCSIRASFGFSVIVAALHKTTIFSRLKSSCHMPIFLMVCMILAGCSLSYTPST